MPLPFSPKFTYDVGPTTLLMTQSSTIWTPDRVLQGGGSESAAGVPENYVIRRDGILNLGLKFLESEWAAVAAFLDFCIGSGSQGWFTFFPDQTKGLNYQSWLLKPKIGEPWGTKRADGYVKALQIDLTLRTRTTGTIYDIPIT